MATKIAKSEFDTVIDSMNQLKSARSKLPGVQSLLAIDQQRVAKGFTDADLEILTGALYMEAERQLQRIPVKRRSAQSIPGETRRAITPDDVKTVLSKPIDTSKYGHKYFGKLLADAKTKLAAEPQYRRKLAAAQTAAKQKTCLWGHAPRWVCIAWGVILVVAIILILVL